MEARSYGPGDVIIRKGEKTRDLFILTQGLVEITSEETDGSIVLNEIRPPEVFGEISFLIEGRARTATATARTRVAVFVLTYDDARNDMDHLPEWLKPILNTLVGRIAHQDQKIKELEEENAALKGTAGP